MTLNNQSEEVTSAAVHIPHYWGIKLSSFNICEMAQAWKRIIQFMDFVSDLLVHV